MGSLESWRLFLQIGFGQHYLVLVILFLFFQNRSKFLQIGYCQNYLRSELGIYSPTSFFHLCLLQMTFLNSYFHLINCFRSAVLFSLKAFPLALDDIQLAFEMGYPDGKYWCWANNQNILINKILHFLSLRPGIQIVWQKSQVSFAFQENEGGKKTWKKGWLGRTKGYFETSN